MAVITKKNILNIGAVKRARLWNDLRDEPYMSKKVTLADLGAAGAVLATILRFSVSAKGLLVFLIGDDPAETK